DANVALDTLLPDRTHNREAVAWMESRRSQGSFCLSMLTVHLVLYFGSKAGLSLAQLKAYLAQFTHIALLPEDYQTALTLIRDNDHEDALQLATALRTNCTAIVTLDRDFATNYAHL